MKLAAYALLATLESALTAASKRTRLCLWFSSRILLNAPSATAAVCPNALQLERACRSLCRLCSAV